MITISQAKEIHEILVERFGGSKGVRDQGLLESSVYRPFHTFGSEDLYASPVDKAAAFLESIVNNHALVDGNKRMGYTLMRLLLLMNGGDIEATEDEKYDFVIAVAEGQMAFEEIRVWLHERLVKGD